MKGKTHAGVGVMTFFAIYDKLPGKFNYVAIIVVFFASLFPDIDHPKSIVNKYILPFKNKATKIVMYTCSGTIVLWYDYMIAKDAVLKAIGVLLIAIAVSSHRTGLTHSLAGMIIFSLIAGYIGKVYNVSYLVYYFMIGYGMHLVCDMMTNRGIPLFYPFKKKNIRFPLTYKSSSKIGNLIEDMIGIIALVYVVYKIYKLVGI